MSQQGALTIITGGGPVIETITGNTGGGVGPSGTFNINILGNNSSGINVVGNPGTNTLTITAFQATTTQEGTVTLATNAQAIAGTNTANVLTPSNLTAKLGTQTLHGLPIGEGTTNPLTWTAALTNGQLLIGSTGADPALGTITSTDGSITITTGAGTIDLANSLGLDRFPITPFVVGPVGLAGYQTIQSALDAANAAGGGVVYVQSSSTPYTEDLTCYDGTSIVGVPPDSDLSPSANTTTIIGVHTPPSSGYFAISRCSLQSSTSIFFSAGGGSSIITVSNCNTSVANGYIWDMVNWGAPGAFIGFNNQDSSTGNNGVINNTGQAIVYLQDSVKGAGAGMMLTSGPITLKNVDLAIPWEMRKNTIQNIDNCRFFGTVNATINATGTFNFCRFVTGATPAFLMNSTDPINMRHCTFSTTNVPSIGGTGAGVLELGAALFNGNTTIAGTVNVTGTDGFLPASFGTTGQVFTSNGLGVVPSFQSISAAGAVTTLTGNSGGAISPTAGNINVVGTGSVSVAGAGSTLTISIAGGGFTWTDVTTATQALLIENGYFTDRGSGVTYTLPTTAVLGAEIKINGKLGLTTIAQNAGQSIRWSSAITTVGVTGTSVGTNLGDCVTLRCSTANTGWIAESFVGNWTIT